MRTRGFGPTGRQVAVIGQGTWKVREHGKAAAAIEEGIRLGLTHIDTAELYEERSASETMLGPIVGRHRKELFLASKVLPRNATARGVVSACKDSLVRLQTDHIDLYYHHWRAGAIPLEETLRAIAGLVDAGWVRHAGVSNYDVADLDEAKSILGPGRIAANQVLYHLEDRGAESGVIPWCRRNGVAVVAYSPFGSGAWLSGKRLALVESVGKAEGLSPHQVALAFLTRDPIAFAIPKAETLAHVRDNAGGDATLSKDAVARLEDAFPVKPGLREI